MGGVHHFSLFDAFYFISFTATTIGYGELPHGFTGGQRLWVTLCIYLVVVSWFYAIGTIVGLVRDENFQRAVNWNRCRRRVRHTREAFYLVCGYGDTGAPLVREITDRGGRAVVIDSDEAQTNELRMADLRTFVPTLTADANLTDNLIAAGLEHGHCKALLAVTSDDHTNLQIAISSKLMNPKLPVIARAEHESTRMNMASFGTDYVVNPFDTFAGGMAMAIQTPQIHRFYEWLSAKPVIPLTSERLPPRGLWIVCGYGRLGHALQERLTRIGIDIMIVAEDELDAAQRPAAFTAGKGTDAGTLRRAGIEGAAGVIAALDDDADNLSIMLTARSLNADIFLIGRQNDPASSAIFEAAQLDMVMEPSSIMALRMLRLLTSPLLPPFLRELRERDDAAVGETLERLRGLTHGDLPTVRTLFLDEATAPAVAERLNAGIPLTIDALNCSIRDRRQGLAAAVVMIERPDGRQILPGGDAALQLGDGLLCVGVRAAVTRFEANLADHQAVHYLLTGERLPKGAVWRWLRGRPLNSELHEEGRPH